jgi:hypothetical protein
MPHDDKRADFRVRFEVTAERNRLTPLHILRGFNGGDSGQREKEEQ